MNKILFANVAREISDSNFNKNIIDFETNLVLDEIIKATKRGEYKIDVYDDEVVRNNLKKLRYNVSDAWNRDDFYKSKIMTISW